MTVWPIIIPSKGRPDQPLFRKLEVEGLDFTILIEPQDVGKYTEHIAPARLMALDHNDMGLAYSRNWTLEIARERGYRWFWVLDDDITGFYRTIGNRCVGDTAKAILYEAQALIQSMPNVGQAALEYQQFAWSAKRQFAVNSYCDVAVAINTVKTHGLQYDTTVNLKEDRDFTLQVLNAGFDTVRCCRLSFGAPKNGSNKGGLFDEYRSGREAQASQLMEKKWGRKICHAEKKPDGRPDVKINWSHFRRTRVV